MDLVTCLADKDTEHVMSSALNVSIETYTYGFSWMPVVDFTYLASPFLPDDPANMLRNGEFQSDIDVMIGATKDEGIIYLTDLLGGNSSTWDLFRENFNIAGTKTLFMIPFLEDMTAQDRQRTDQLVEFYLSSYDNITEQNAQAVIDLFSDSGSNYGNYLFTNQVVARGTRLFSYILTYRGEFSYTDVIGIPNYGVSHADDLLYLWNPVFTVSVDLNDSDQAMMRQMVSTWTDFAKTGDPPPPSSPYSWLPVTAGVQEEDQQWFFNFSGENSAMDSSQQIFSRLIFWDNILTQTDLK